MGRSSDRMTVRADCGRRVDFLRITEELVLPSAQKHLWFNPLTSLFSFLYNLRDVSVHGSVSEIANDKRYIIVKILFNIIL